MWNESHRFYHTLTHLNDLIDQINEDKSKYSEKEYEKLLITALFHDCIYDPMKSDNEEKSADFFIEYCQNKSDNDNIDIKNMILDTKTHNASLNLSESFNNYDMNIVERNIEQLLEWEDGIYNEFKGHGINAYKNGRIKFLESVMDNYPNNTENLLKLINYVKTKY
jgi:predicted metal-dependent HD superfamily phosphohydrolase